MNTQRHNNLKRFFTGLWGSLFLLTFVWVFISRIAHAELMDRVVAEVNNEVITLTELNEMIHPYAEKIKTMGYSPEREREMLFKVREEKLNQLIAQKLEEQEIREKKITIDENEVDAALERIKEANYFTDEDLRSALEREGSSIEAYREQLKKQILRQKLVSYEIKSKIVITKEDIKKYYTENQDKYSGEGKYHLRNIVMNVPRYSDDETKETIMKKMEGILAELKQGASFQEMAKRYSESPYAASGGDLGAIEMNLFSEQLQEALTKIKPGEFTGILDTDQGYQIFFLEEILPAKGKTLEEASAEIEEILYNKVIDEKYQTWIENLRKRSHIKIVN